jgi:hypothetical protein
MIPAVQACRDYRSTLNLTLLASTYLTVSQFRGRTIMFLTFWYDVYEKDC